MRKQSVLMLVVAIALGTASVVLLRGWLEKQLAAAQPAAHAVATVPVVVARTQLPFGSRIHRENLAVVPWPAGSVPEGALSSIEELVSANEDRVALRSMEASEPVLVSKVSGLGGRATLSTVVAKEHRAITIRVNDVLGVAGFVLPGDRVDILLTRKDDARRDRPTTDVLLQNIRVLGIDQDASDRKDKPTVARAVTLEVSTDEAQKLTLGSQIGQLSLALRNQSDGDEAKVRTIGLDDLGPGRSAAAPTPSGRTSGARVSVLRGTDSATYAVRAE